jgi:hypothetical protein
MQGCTTVQSDDPTQACGEGTAANANDINISWQDIVSGSAPAPGLASSTCSSLGSETSWNAQNMLRIELVPLSSSGTITRADLINDSYTAYLCPDGTSGGATYAVSGNTGVDSGQILSSSCTVAPGASGTNPPHLCSVHLNVGPLNDSTYFLIMRGIYNNPVQATATMTGSTGLLNIGDAQMLVDSTGQAQNILKRVQARIPESNEYNLPNAAVQGEVCKQIEIGPTTEYAPNESTDDSPCSTGVNSIRSAITP